MTWTYAFNLCELEDFLETSTASHIWQVIYVGIALLQTLRHRKTGSWANYLVTESDGTGDQSPLFCSHFYRLSLCSLNQPSHPQILGVSVLWCRTIFSNIRQTLWGFLWHELFQGWIHGTLSFLQGIFHVLLGPTFDKAPILTCSKPDGQVLAHLISQICKALNHQLRKEATCSPDTILHLCCLVSCIWYSFLPGYHSTRSASTVGVAQYSSERVGHGILFLSHYEIVAFLYSLPNIMLLGPRHCADYGKAASSTLQVPCCLCDKGVTSVAVKHFLTITMK